MQIVNYYYFDRLIVFTFGHDLNYKATQGLQIVEIVKFIDQ